MMVKQCLTFFSAISLSLALNAQDLDTESQVLSMGVRKDVPFVPTPEAVVEEMLRLARIGKDDVLYDLGSGDGRIVVAAAKRYGARGVGVDIDPERIAEGNANARKAGVEKRVRFVQGDLFKVDLSEATAVTLYLLPSINIRLRPKLLAELEPGTPVVSHSFDMGDWKPDSQTIIDGKGIYTWIIPANVAGSWDMSVNGASGLYRLNLQQTYQKATGTVEVDGKPIPIRACSLSGNRISLTFQETVNGRPVIHRFRGKVDGNKMMGGAGKNKWYATRASTAPTAAASR